MNFVHTEQARRRMLEEFTPVNMEEEYSHHLCKISAWSTLAMLLFFPVQILVYFLFPPPDTVIGWFDLFERNPLIGLINMDLILILDYLILGIVVLTLFFLLRNLNKAVMTLALMFQLIAIATYFSSATAFEMLSLGKRYAEASPAAQASLHAAGEAMLTTWQGSAFIISYVLSGLALVLVSLVMLKSTLFTRTTGWLGLTVGIAGCIPPTVGRFGLLLSFISLIPLVIWLFLLLKRFFTLSRQDF